MMENKNARDWARVLSEYRHPCKYRSSFEIAATVVPFVAIWALAWWVLSYSTLLAVLIASMNSLFLVRLFCIQHDFREMASGLSCPVGFKNGTDGSLDVALNALQSVKSPHRFLGISPDGKVSIVTTKGNAHAHVVLRGGTNGPNYYPENIAVCEEELESIGATQAIMVDCSHANSNKDHTKQGSVLEAVAEQISVGNKSIRGVMLESNLKPGNQKVDSSQELQYGVSITDACIGWEETERLLKDFHKALP